MVLSSITDSFPEADQSVVEMEQKELHAFLSGFLKLTLFSSNSTSLPPS